MAVAGNDKASSPSRFFGAMAVGGLFVAGLGVAMVLTVALAAPGVIVFLAGLGWSGLSLAAAKTVEHWPWE
jgi:hypothetical protein